MQFQFERNSKFALLVVVGIASDIPPTAEFQLSDGTWVLPGVPVQDWGVWTQWIGSIRSKQLQRANLVLLATEESTNPEILDDVHSRLTEDLGKLFYCLHLQQGIECAEQNDANLIAGSSKDGEPNIRQMSLLPAFHQTRGYRRKSITAEWLENAVSLRSGMKALTATKGDFARLIRGLNVLFSGLQEFHGEERAHQFVRSIEALVLPDTGKTRKQFVHRAETFCQSGRNAQSALQEAFDMRSDTEHLQDWNRAVQAYPASEREDVCLQRTRQMEQLACFAYSRLLTNPQIREHFRTDSAIADFWRLTENARRAAWGSEIDITAELRHSQYHSIGRALP